MISLIVSYTLYNNKTRTEKEIKPKTECKPYEYPSYWPYPYNLSIEKNGKT